MGAAEALGGASAFRPLLPVAQPAMVAECSSYWPPSQPSTPYGGMNSGANTAGAVLSSMLREIQQVTASLSTRTTRASC